MALSFRVYLERFKKWINSTWTCIKCGRTFHLFCFGYGSIICPDCYQGEQPWRLPA